MVVTPYEIPLSGVPQRFSIALPNSNGDLAAGFVLTFSYRDVPQDLAGGCGWVLDIADQYGEPVLCGIPLVTGADLLAQYEYLGLGGHLTVHTDGTPDATPTFDNLGTTSRLYWVTIS